MRISELAHLTGVSIRSLRHYELKGLIRPRRLANSYRDYDESAIDQVRVIQFYLGLGLNTDEIKRIVNCKGQHVWEVDNAVCAEGLIALYEKKMQTIDDEMQVLAGIKARLLGRIRWMQGGNVVRQ
jgi:MerR family transcriptional regulator, Zn(II)-responsive regulator of zntA